MRISQPTGDSRLQVLLDPRRIVRWVYIGRLSVASAIFIAAVIRWQNAVATDTLVATLAFASALVFTVVSAMYTEIYRRETGRTFLYLQTLFDLLLVTCAVHVTRGAESQFAALYIVVIAIAALLLPAGGGLLIAMLGNVLYFADVIWWQDRPLGGAVWFQLVVFGLTALASGWISSRLQAEGAWTAEELKRELHRVRLEAADILRNIRSGIVTTDANGQLLYANPAASALLGFPIEDRIGLPVLDDIRDAAPELARAMSRAAADRVRTSRLEGTLRREGITVPIGVTTTYAEGTGDVQVGSVTAIFQDIADQKRIEALNMRAERLEAVAELSASLAHEIRNPLAGIRSAVEQLARRPAADEDERTLGALIVRESDRLSRLLAEFLDFARVRVSRVAPVDVAAVARDAASLAAAHPDRRDGVKIACTTPDGVVSVDGDEDLLHRALFNLALNAVQAVPSDGEVTIEVAPVPLAQLPSGVSTVAFEKGAVALRVRDTGPGIPPEIRDRMFDPFITTKPGGSGLGLPIVHRAIEAHRGLVFVDSSAGGTQFTVLLPRGHDSNGASE